MFGELLLSLYKRDYIVIKYLSMMKKDLDNDLLVLNKVYFNDLNQFCQQMHLATFTLSH